MAKINILSSTVYNKIAAGEVVERPASIVKELVENSIDAGAKNIEISIENGGLDTISVADNGCGIESQYVETAFLNHATSKIAQESDLEKIYTLGFRGEALSSIAAVSKVEITTKTTTDDFGTKLVIEGGEIASKEIFGAAQGTSIKVSNLFFNTPARKKFLKKPSGEAAEITNLVQRLILSNPDVAIKYTSNGNIVFNSQGLGLEAAIFAVYGKGTLENCKKIAWFYKDIEVDGYVGNKNFTKPNRTYQTVIVNGRYVVNSTVCTAVQRAFDRYLTTRAYPFFVLNVKIPYEKIDINVHPNKMEVKFEDSQNVFYAVYIPIKEMLDGGENKAVPEVKISSEQLEIKKNIPENQSVAAVNTPSVKFTDDDEKLLSNFSMPRFNTGLSAPAFHFTDDRPQKNNDAQQKPESGAIRFSESKNIGTAFDTYVIIQKDANLFFIDQHAAHEMLLFDKFTADYHSKRNIKQQLLVPYTFSVKQDEFEFIADNLDKINDCGFTIEEFGVNSFKISEVPLIFSNINFDKFINSFLTDLDTEKIDIKYIYDKLAKSACRAAVKAGDKLTEADINCLKDSLDGSSILRCPHGRPVAVKVSKLEIEKWFKRVI